MPPPGMPASVHSLPVALAVPMPAMPMPMPSERRDLWDMWLAVPPPGHLSLLGGTPPPSPPEGGATAVPSFALPVPLHLLPPGAGGASQPGVAPQVPLQSLLVVQEDVPFPTSLPPSPPEPPAPRYGTVVGFLARGPGMEPPVLSLSLVFGAVGAAGAALSAHQSEMASIFPVFFGAVCLSLAAFSVSNALLCGDELARAWAFVIPLHPLPLTALLLLVPADDLLRAKESVDIFRLPGTVLVGAIGAVTATMPRPLRWKCMVVAGFLLSTASNFGVATYLLDERLSFICEMFPYHLSALGSLALTLLCQKAIKEFIGQQIVVRAAPKPTMLPWVSVNFEDGGANERVTRACLAGAFACICLLIVSHHLLLFREQREEWGMRRDAADAMPTGSHGGGRGGGMVPQVATLFAFYTLGLCVLAAALPTSADLRRGRRFLLVVTVLMLASAVGTVRNLWPRVAALPDEASAPYHHALLAGRVLLWLAALVGTASGAACRWRFVKLVPCADATLGLVMLLGILLTHARATSFRDALHMPVASSCSTGFCHAAGDASFGWVLAVCATNVALLLMLGVSLSPASRAGLAARAKHSLRVRFMEPRVLLRF
mmetsp:Transcript_31694/g.104878  ORF Transcript_31694/g.104878 Transcript_31694/m.104878 type:complete len:602 (+) Transcript_31694:1588-3393(+)